MRMATAAAECAKCGTRDFWEEAPGFGCEHCMPIASEAEGSEEPSEPNSGWLFDAAVDGASSGRSADLLSVVADLNFPRPRRWRGRSR